MCHFHIKWGRLNGGDAEWYATKITEYNPQTGLHHLDYDDGTQEDKDLSTLFIGELDGMDDDSVDNDSVDDDEAKAPPDDKFRPDVSRSH